MGETMALTKLTKDMAVIAALDDEPNDVGGLTAAQLKAKFDEAGESLKEYLNGTLLAELEDSGAAASLGAVLDGEAVNVQKALDDLALAQTQNGNVPTGGETGTFLCKKSGEQYDMAWVHAVAAVPFQQADWTQGEDGLYSLALPQTAHHRVHAAFGVTLRHSLDGVLTDRTWAALGTQTRYDADTGDVVLTAPDPYDGAAVFYG